MSVFKLSAQGRFWQRQLGTFQDQYSVLPLPDFTETGDLPQGVFAASLQTALARFGSGSAKRIRLALRLKRIYALATETGHLVRLVRFVVFGSFVTRKSEPNDVDVFMIMDDHFEVGQLSGERRFLFDHATAESHFGCSVFWVRQIGALGGEQVAIEYWQIKRGGGHRGIVEITATEP